MAVDLDWMALMAAALLWMRAEIPSWAIFESISFPAESGKGTFTKRSTMETI